MVRVHSGLPFLQARSLLPRTATFSSIYLKESARFTSAGGNSVVVVCVAEPVGISGGQQARIEHVIAPDGLDVQMRTLLMRSLSIVECQSSACSASPFLSSRICTPM
jgi:hypothetical protein